MKYFLIAGEASGDLHASHLMRSLKKLDEEADFRYFGGDLMQAAGGTLLKHYREMAYMGIIPVMLHLRTIFRNMDFCKQSIEAYQPDAVILVDYPGFNLKIAKYLKGEKEKRRKGNRRTENGKKETGETGFPFSFSPSSLSPFLPPPVSIYYISPKIWAWKTYRIKSIKRYIDKMLCILPFEVDFYKKYTYLVDYVGNPTVDEIAGRDYKNETFEQFIETYQLENKPVIALLAGSRKQEIKSNLPAMLEAAAPFNDYQLLIAGAPGIDVEYYQQFTRNYPAKVISGHTYRLLQQARAALVTSGTATLETALLRVPQTVCYRMPFKRISSFIFQNFFSCRYISLVNLIAGKTVVQELFANSFSVKNIREELDRLLHNETYRLEMDAGYQEVIVRLGTPGAADKAAEQIYKNYG